MQMAMMIAMVASWLVACWCAMAAGYHRTKCRVALFLFDDRDPCPARRFDVPMTGTMIADALGLETSGDRANVFTALRAFESEGRLVSEEHPAAGGGVVRWYQRP